MIELQNHEPFGQGMIDLEVAEHTQLEPVAIFPEDHEDPWRIFFCFFFKKTWHFPGGISYYVFSIF